MFVKDMFVKPIDRDIQGVIIVGQGEETNVAQELDEYVVTRELQTHFTDFFSAYKKGILGTTPKMGVWISGFFGSGKSHFLKILSYILGNKRIGNRRAIDYFIEDKGINNQFLLGDMKLASDTPTDVILFNIDSKSEATGKQDKDAIVNVFLKVFNEMQGLCGTLPHLADLEQQLIEKGQIDAFKKSFENGYGKAWEDSRHKFDFIQDYVVDALVEIGFMSEAAARNWCEKASEPYKISIEDFAKRVAAYLEKKEKNHHIVFLVDEVGQYIGDNSKLMLNLQTVTEELGIKCKGKAWIIVTSQQDIDSITNVKGNDFSKIQGRFETRLSLSSANVDEVIKKRILEKTDTASKTLRLLFEQKSTFIKNLIVFNDSVEKKLYASSSDFSDVYPFVPYQFKLLADVLTSIRVHGASGKHLSEGERSMLAMFKESADRVKDEEEGVIVPFHMFYDAMDNFLDHSHRSVILRAYDNEQINPEQSTEVFAIDVLKTLFLIKYVPEIDPNLENITSLMVRSISDDRITLKEKVEEALKILLQQMLIQKNGNRYIFLTDEEQEINREIDSQNVEIAEIINKVSEMIYEDIFTDKKYRYPAFNGRYAFSFNQIVDNRPYKSNQSNDLCIRILTPWFEGSNDDQALRMMSSQASEILVVLPNDTAFLEEIRSYLKIEKFLRLNTSSQLTKYEVIKEAKRVEMRDRNDFARVYLTDSLKSAVIYSRGDIVSTSSKDVSGRINEALGKLVRTVYYKLPYITSAMGETEIRNMFRDANGVMIDLEKNPDPNSHALDDVFSYIAGNSKIHSKTSMKTVKDRFMKAPYGFIDDDVHWLVAKLFIRGDLAFSVNGEAINLNNKSSDEIISYITKKAFVEKLLMEERVRVSEKDKKIVRSVIKEVFNSGISSEDEDVIMKNFQHFAQNKLIELQKLDVEYIRFAYPGKKIVDMGKELMKSVQTYHDAQQFFRYIAKRESDFLDFADYYGPVKKFFEGEQKGIFTETLKLLDIFDDSRSYIADRDLEKIASDMKAIVRMDNPYSNIHKLPALCKDFREAYTILLEKEETPVLDVISQSKNRVLSVLNSKAYASDYRDRYERYFYDLQTGAEKSHNIAELRGYADKAEALKMRLLNEMTDRDNKIAQQKAEEEKKKKKEEELNNNHPKGALDPVSNPDTPQPKIKKTKHVRIKDVTHVYSWQLENEADIDKCLSSLRQSLLKELSNNDIVNVEF